MKKLILLAVMTALVACGAQAQKKNTTRSNTKAPTISVTQDPGASSGFVSLDNAKTIELPLPEQGLDMPAIEIFKLRCTTREMGPEELPLEIVSSILWAAYGFNRPDEGKRTAPSAINVQEFDIYLFNQEGVYLYDAAKNALIPCLLGDHRAEISQQKHFAIAPISIVMVANYGRMTKFKSTEDRDFYAACDAGYISQNIYLACASARLATVACGGIDREAIHKLLGITNGRALLAHPVSIKH